MGSPKKYATVNPLTKGIENAITDKTAACSPAFLISLGSICNPANNIRKKTPKSESTVRLSFGVISFNTYGPIIIPAASSPTRGGILSLWKNSPNKRAATKIITTLMKSCSVAMNYQSYPNQIYPYAFRIAALFTQDCLSITFIIGSNMDVSLTYQSILS